MKLPWERRWNNFSNYHVIHATSKVVTGHLWIGGMEEGEGALLEDAGGVCRLAKYESIYTEQLYRLQPAVSS